MLFTLIGGVIADRHDRRRILLTSQYIQMADGLRPGGAGLLGGRRGLAHPGAVVHHRLAQAFGGPAYQSLIPSLVEQKDLPNAIALNSIQFNLARVIGPLLAGARARHGARRACDGAASPLNGLSFLVGDRRR